MRTTKAEFKLVKIEEKEDLKLETHNNQTNSVIVKREWEASNIE